VTEVAGRPACVNYNCCGARDEGDEATLKGSSLPKERRGWEEAWNMSAPYLGLGAGWRSV
jgi:hypothetical protein